MAVAPTYLLAPNTTFRPGGPIALGTLVADPLRPHRPLTAIDKDALLSRYPPVERVIERREMTRDASHDVSMSIWTQFLQIVDTQLSGNRGSHNRTKYSFPTLVTEYFTHDPAEAEIKARIAVSKIRKIMKGKILRQPVYMVNGVKIATGFAASKVIEHTHGGAIEAGVPILPPHVSVGAGVGLQKSVGKSDKWEVEGDIIFAYQLLKIELKGWREEKLLVDELKHKAAYLSLGDDTKAGADGVNANDDDDILVTNVKGIEDLDEDEDASLVRIEVGGNEVSLVVYPDE